MGHGKIEIKKCGGNSDYTESIHIDHDGLNTLCSLTSAEKIQEEIFKMGIGRGNPIVVVLSVALLVWCSRAKNIDSDHGNSGAYFNVPKNKGAIGAPSSKSCEYST